MYDAAESLGEIMTGDSIVNADYEVLMNKPQMCKVLCRTELKTEEALLFEDRIKKYYKVQWLLDDLPAATARILQSEGDMDNTHLQYLKGFSLGFVMQQFGSSKAHINNHVRLNVLINEDEQMFKGFRVVGLEVEPFSVEHVYPDWRGKDTDIYACQNGEITHSMKPQVVTSETKEIVWTYDVKFIKSSIKWTKRWDQYLKVTDDRIHWYSVTNSLLIVFLLSGLAGIILVRALRKDLARYNELVEDEQEMNLEETGWKVVHADVFRPPVYAGILAAFVGSGVQMIAMLIAIFGLALMGFLSPANRGALLTSLIVLFCLMGYPAGYIASRLGRFCEVAEWQKIAIATAFIFPGTSYFIFFVVNLALWSEQSSAAVPFGTLVVLLLLWIGLQTPLVYFGAMHGFKQEVRSFFANYLK